MNDPAINSVIAAQQGALQSQIQMAVAAKQLSAVKQQGQAVVELIEAAMPQGKAAGQGTKLDVSA